MGSGPRMRIGSSLQAQPPSELTGLSFRPLLLHRLRGGSDTADSHGDRDAMFWDNDRIISEADRHKNVLLPVSEAEVLKRVKQLKDQGVAVNQEHVDEIFKDLLTKQNGHDNVTQGIPTEEEIRSMMEKHKAVPGNESARVGGRVREGWNPVGSIDTSSEDIARHELSSDVDVWKDLEKEKKPPPGTLVEDDEDHQILQSPRGVFISENIPGLQKWRASTKGRPSSYKTGERVILGGLKTTTSLNGKEAIVMGNITSDKRYPLRLVDHNAKLIAVKPKHLLPSKIHRFHERKKAEENRFQTLINESYSLEKNNTEYLLQFEWGGKGRDFYVPPAKNHSKLLEMMDVNSYQRWDSTKDPEAAEEKSTLISDFLNVHSEGHPTRNGCGKSIDEDLALRKQWKMLNFSEVKSGRARWLSEQIQQLEDKMRKLSLEFQKAASNPVGMIPFMKQHGAADDDVRTCMSNENDMRRWVISMFKSEGGELLGALEKEFQKEKLAEERRGREAMGRVVDESPCERV
eukprot:CAMPEP_0114506886 /NCGR_PEP_ID=MMETSP0109-20121206/11692_1 /TAXON_ID=29199 /ORGANISM="Chlorarachnion reptans, Strain CCCM449" /LENGTH=516 /DNA_ID=CAMNT_0001685555 /DNA_START=248 /DNA_END=1798 /DNA_ORIENTATION=+